MTMPAILVTPQGAPIVSSDVIRRTKQVDPRLDCRAFPAPRDARHSRTQLFNFPGSSIPAQKEFASADSWSFAYTYQWAENDPRRARIRSGEIAPDKDFDILGFFPADTREGDFPLFLQKFVREAPEHMHEVRQLLQSLERWNRNVEASNEAEALAPTHRVIDEMAAAKVRGSKVAVAKDITPRRRRAPTAWNQHVSRELAHGKTMKEAKESYKPVPVQAG